MKNSVTDLYWEAFQPSGYPIKIMNTHPNPINSGAENSLKQNGSGDRIDKRIVTYHNESAPIAEQYRILRTNIKTYFFKKKLDEKNPEGIDDTKILCITSSISGEGKTITAANIAVSLAKDMNNSVLLIDGDFRKGDLHKLFQTKHTPGLTELLKDEKDFAETIYPTPVENLFFMPRGGNVSNPSEMLGSTSMRILLNELKRQNFSYIIIDTPPIISYTDAAILGAITEGSIFIIQANKTPSYTVKKAISLLEHAYVNLIGFVLTQCD